MDAYREELVSEMIHEALDSLPETYQQVLTLYYLGGMNSREIAEFLGTSPAAIRERLSRARSQLKEGMLAMMSTTFEAKRLPASFTFRIVEAIKHVKIQPLPRMSGLPWGLSFATGIIITVLSLSPHLSIFNPANLPTGSPLPVEAKVLKVGEIPVDVLEISHIPVISSKQENGDGGESILPAPEKNLLLAPHGEGGTWTQKTDMPTARWGFGTSVVDGKIQAIGGVVRMGWNLTPAVECYDPVNDTWEIKANMPTMRAELSTCVANGKIYAIGGTKNSNSSLPTVEVYDPVADTWEARSPMPTARSAFSTSVVDGIIYAIGGKIGWNIPALSTVEAYDPEADTWTEKADMPTARCYLSTSAVDGIIYAIGGSPWNADWAACATVEAYDPVANTWTKKTNMIEARGSLSTVVLDGKIYAVGGTEDGSSVGLQVIEVHDLEGY
jgi:N-acetylneuraminic acid mutarotase